MKKIKNLLVLLTSIFVFSIPFIQTYALTSNSNKGLNGLTAKERIANTESNKGTESAIKAKENLRKKLEGLKLKACQNKANAIKIRSRNIVGHAIKQIEVFDKIASRTSEFYNDKIIPQGKTLENYDELIGEINAKKDAIKPLIEAAKTDVEEFNCESEGPANKINQFKEDIKAIIEAMQAYKKSVKNLIVAVRTLAGDIDLKTTVTVTPATENTQE